MSQSLSFEQSTPDVELAYYVDADAADYDSKKLAHCACQGENDLYNLKRLGQVLEEQKNSPILPVETLVAMEQSVTGNRAFGRMLIDRLVNDFKAGKPIFGHSLLLVGLAVKAYFDIDLSVSADQLQADAVNSRLRRAINFLARSAGFDPDWQHWVILVCPYPEAKKKFSAHLIYQRWSFKGPTVLKKWLDENIDWNVAQQEHGFDPKPYKANQNFRLPGGSRFVPLTNRRAALENVPKHYPFVFLHPQVHHHDVTWSHYASALPGFVPSTCQRIDVDGGSQMISHAQNLVPGFQGTLPGKVIACLQEWGRSDSLNLDMGYFRISNNDDDPINVVPDEICFYLKGYDGYLACNHASEEILVKLLPKAEVFFVCCGQCGEIGGGLTNRSCRFLCEYEFVCFLADFGLNRPDFCYPGAENSPGHYGMTTEQFYKMLRGIRRAEYESGQFICSQKYLAWLLADESESAIPLRFDGSPLPIQFVISGTNAGGVFNLEMVDFLNNLKPPGDNGISDAMINYINCFVCCIGNHYFLRGIGDQTKAQMAEFMAPLKCYAYKRPKATKKEPDPDWNRLTKSIFDLWKEHGGRRTYKSFWIGPLDFSLKSQMNALKPVAYDLEQCLDSFDNSDIATQQMLREAYIVLIEMYIYTEPEQEVKKEMRHSFHRFFHANIFKFFERKGLGLVLCSDKGGQGKSWGGEMIGKMVGPAYYKSFDGANWNADKFNQVNGLNVLNELEFKTLKDASELKSRSTGDMFPRREMFKTPVQEQNNCSFWISTNELNLKGLSVDGMERRLCVTSLLETDMYDAENLFHYQCEFCEEDECKHSFYCHSDLMALLRDEIFTNPEGIKCFIGMLYRYYNELAEIEPEWWARKMGTWCPQSHAGALLRKRNENSVEAFFDDCVERGAHFSAKLCPPANSSFKTIFLTKTQSQRLATDVVNPDCPPTWEFNVAEQSLYAAYRWYCQKRGSSAVANNDFNEKFKKYYRERVVRGINPSLVVKEVFQHEWRSAELVSNKWVVSTNPCLKMKVWTMGQPWAPLMKIVEENRRRKNGRLNKSRTGLFPSTSSSDALFKMVKAVSPKPRPLNYPVHRPVQDGSCFELDSQHENYLGEFANAIDDYEDANDGFADPGFHNRTQMLSASASSEASQDRRAELHDNRLLKRNRFMDDEAEQSDSHNDSF
jgi:hypothetical protein